MEVVSFETRQRLGPGVYLPARMTALCVGDAVALVSPIRLDDELAAAVGRLGSVRWLIAPNLFHHLHVGAAKARFPSAQLLAPRDLARKRPDLVIDGFLDDGLPADLAAHVTHVPLRGADRIGEHLLFHRSARTLVATDLVFNVTRPEGFWTRLVLSMVGAKGRLAQSRSWRFFTTDAAALDASLAEALELPIERLVMAHGDIVEVDAHARFAGALRRTPQPAALPARS